MKKILNFGKLLPKVQSFFKKTATCHTDEKVKFEKQKEKRKKNFVEFLKDNFFL